MRSLFENKRLVLLLAALALGALTLLAISLNQVPFREGQHFAQQGRTEVPVLPGDPGQTWIEVPIWKQVMFWILVGMIFILIGLLLSPEMRKRLLRILIRMALTFWAFYFLIKHYGDRLIGLKFTGGGEPAPNQNISVPMPTFEPPKVSPAFSYLISFATALILLGLTWVLYRVWQRYVALNSKKPLDALAKIARSSLDDLTSGRNSSDVIINCYLRMSDVVFSARHLHRNAAMTPHEFALHLEQAGLPAEAVSRLTRLFEGVRYGARKSGPQDINEAVTCLKTILHYCGEPV